MVSLPNELVLRTLGCLGKQELKIARLVCRIWCYYASESLFDKLYISPRKEDIHVFESITQHPQLARCVKELEYDATLFSRDMPESHYFWRLLRCTPMKRNVNRDPIDKDNFQSRYNARQQKHFDPQVDEYLKMINESQDIRVAFSKYNTCRQYNFILEGHRKWRECSLYEQRCMQSGDFLRILVYGLRNLDRLESVNMCQKWTSRHFYITQSDPTYYYPSPFGRTWDVFHAQPLGWANEDHVSDACDQIWTITTALSSAQRRIRRFDPRPVPANTFNTDKITSTMVDCSVNAYSGLRDLDLMLVPDEHQVEDHSKLVKLPGLQRLLQSMNGLRNLKLTIDHWSSNKWSAFDQVFPGDGQWLGLTSLNLTGMFTPAKDLVRLLTARMPKLRDLYLLEIELVDGSWEGVVECMKTSMSLESLGLEDCSGPLAIGYDGSAAMKEVTDEKAVELYVLRGGRHPRLLPNEPDSASEKYLSAPWL